MFKHDISAQSNTSYFDNFSLIDRLCFDLFFKQFWQKFKHWTQWRKSFLSQR